MVTPARKLEGPAPLTVDQRASLLGLTQNPKCTKAILSGSQSTKCEAHLADRASSEKEGLSIADASNLKAVY